MAKSDLTLDVYVISRLTHIYYTGELRKLGITMGQFPFLMGLQAQDGISQEKLSGMIRISKSTTAVIIGQLVAKGLVRRSVDESDRRNFRLSLTPEGRELIPRIQEVIRRCHALITDGFSSGDRKILGGLLYRARANAEEKLRRRRSAVSGAGAKTSSPDETV